MPEAVRVRSIRHLTALELGEKSFSDRILIEAAKGWFTNSRREKRARGTPSYYDRHGFDTCARATMLSLLPTATRAACALLREAGD